MFSGVFSMGATGAIAPVILRKMVYLLEGLNYCKNSYGYYFCQFVQKTVMTHISPCNFWAKILIKTKDVKLL